MAIPEFAWPPFKAESRPWTYWWWMGSAVDREEITRLLETYRQAGIGGVHIVPIYGVKGAEEHYVNYLSKEWMDLLKHTVEEAGRLGMGVDMTLGTGWPFGGPWMDDSNSSCRMQYQTYELSVGERLTHPVVCRDTSQGKDARLMTLMAFSDESAILDLTERVNSRGELDWIAPSGVWKLFAVFRGWTGQQVKRAAPGDEGPVMDYFSKTATRKYLSRFDQAFKNWPAGNMPRSFYHDSYEVYEADWTAELFPEFQKRRGYDLRRYLPELLSDTGDPAISSRVRCDYRQTIADLLLEGFTRTWVTWCHNKSVTTRNQAHGSPGNILDLYAAADIPETESFGPSGFMIPGLRVEENFPSQFGRPEKLMMKFASSAAHLKGRPYASSESCTWLGEHFQVALSQVKPEIDQLFVSGINHVFFHGMTYSPARAPWPGWRFYATTNFNPTNPFWDHLPELNAYITRCQSFLQSGISDNNILLYFPIFDLWQREKGVTELESTGEILQFLGVHNLGLWFYDTPLYQTAHLMWEKGFTFDYVSDLLLETVAADNRGLCSGGLSYGAVVVPESQYMPVRTLDKLLSLAKDGATVLFVGKLPTDFPGLSDFENNRSKFENLLSEIKPLASGSEDISHARLGAGRIMIGNDLQGMLELAEIPREPAADRDIDFVRRSAGDGNIYFFSNLGPKKLDDWVSLAVHAESAVFFDPLRNVSGLAAVRRGDRGESQVRLQLDPGESLILRTYTDRLPAGKRWRYSTVQGQFCEIKGTWEIEFIKGGPEIPERILTDSLLSWTEIGGDKARVFAGTARYRIKFQKCAQQAPGWLLELGQVHESARVSVNGSYAGTVWSHPFRIEIGGFLREGENILEIEVTNLAANRIADMDRRQVPWRLFHDINFVNINYEPFDASGWSPKASGLLGPIYLAPLDLTVLTP